MQAIRTVYRAPTNSRPGRIKATAAAGSVTMAWDHSLDQEQNHVAACLALKLKFGWTGDYYSDTICGQLPDGSYVHVFLPKAR